MINRVLAIVVSHDAPEYLKTCLDALRTQTRPADSIVVVDSSRDRLAIAKLCGGPSVRLVEVNENATLQDSIVAGLAASESYDWIWLLHDDSAAAPDALAQLLDTVERSPSVSLLGPKQLDWNQPRMILQQGLTLTRSGALFSLVADELDQSQHDAMDDVLAVGTAGALIRVATWNEIGGLDAAAPPLAADIDFSLRVRLAGQRVSVVPAAKLRHAALGIRGERAHSWQSSTKTALRRAEIHLRLAYLPMPLALLYWLALPLIGFGLAAIRIAQKRPNRMLAEVSAALWGFFTVASRMRSRRNLRGLAGGRSLARFAILRADGAQVREARDSRASGDAHADSPAEPQQGFAALVAGAAAAERSPSGFIASGGLWWLTLLTALSIPFFPSDAALTGGSLLPLSQDWFEVFRRAGASWQPLSTGFFGPADPQGWLLTALASITFWAPNLALLLLWFLAKPLAFVGAWRLATRLSRHGRVRTTAALAYALSMPLALAQSQGSLPGLVTAVALPWLATVVFQLATENLPASRLWSKVGTAGLLAAAISAAAPSIAPFVVVLIAASALGNLRRTGYLIWTGLPLAAIFAPIAFYAVAWIEHPLAIFADPGVAVANPSLLELIAQNPLGWLCSVAPLVLLALFALLSQRTAQALAGWGIALLGAAAAWVISIVDFADGSSPSVLPRASLAMLGLIIAATAMLETLAEFDPKARRGRRPMHYLLAAVAVLAPLTVGLVQPLPSDLKFTDAEVQPSIVEAEAAHGQQLRTLEIAVLPPAKDKTARFSVQLQSPQGHRLEDLSVMYRMARATGSLFESTRDAQLVELTANLASANGVSVAAAFKELGIGYVLVPPAPSDPVLAAATADLAYSLNSSAELERSGESRFGQLWSVVDAQPAASAVESDDIWSITKGVQLAVILAFLLLAVPTSRRRTRAVDSSIFDSSVEELGISESEGDRA